METGKGPEINTNMKVMSNISNKVPMEVSTLIFILLLKQECGEWSILYYGL